VVAGGIAAAGKAVGLAQKAGEHATAAMDEE
jgi:hypothetical protein